MLLPSPFPPGLVAPRPSNNEVLGSHDAAYIDTCADDRFVGKNYEYEQEFLICFVVIFFFIFFFQGVSFFSISACLLSLVCVCQPDFRFFFKWGEGSRAPPPPADFSGEVSNKSSAAEHKSCEQAAPSPKQRAQTVSSTACTAFSMRPAHHKPFLAWAASYACAYPSSSPMAPMVPIVQTAVFRFQKPYNLTACRGGGGGSSFFPFFFFFSFFLMYGTVHIAYDRMMCVQMRQNPEVP